MSSSPPQEAKGLRLAPNKKLDGVVVALVGLAAFALYLRTLAPSVAFLFDDTLELQYVVPRLGIIHQTGYPLYALLGKLFTLIVPLNDPAFRLNLLSAVNGALAVALVYLVLCHLVRHRFAAAVGALTFAVGQTFWAQAVIAETYTTQMLIVAGLLYLALTWREQVDLGDTARARRRLYALAFLMGLGLTHHRLIALLYPALAVYVLLTLWKAPSSFRDRGTWLRAVALFIVPLSLYLYLPLRGGVGSADGEYVNTLQGFIAWIMAQKYTVFLTSNPLNVQRAPAYYLSLFQLQFGAIGLALAAVGVVWLLRLRRELIFLLLALVLEAGFAFNYWVANVQVHFLTTFLLLALFVGAGADGLFQVVADLRFRFAEFNPAAALMGLLLLLIPAQLAFSNFVANDLSNKWDAHDYGIELLEQPLEKNATIVGIQGELTLIRYFQENEGRRPDIQTVRGDTEEERLAAVNAALAEHKTVYLTRKLEGAAERYALSSVGPLIRAQSQHSTEAPAISHPVGQDFGPSVQLLGYDLDTARLAPLPGRWHAENGRWLQVTLYWKVLDKVESDAMVSLKLLDKDHHAVAQLDRRPVLDTYPTTDWRVGQVISDAYAVPVFLGAPPGTYDLSVTMYDAQSGAPIGQRDLEQIALASDLTAPRREIKDVTHPTGADLGSFSLRDAWNIAHPVDADFGGFSLAGYSLEADAPVRPGDTLPLNLLWRAGSAPITQDLVLRVWLEDAEGKAASSRDARLGDGYPVNQWQPYQYVRDWPTIRVPANVVDGKYVVKLAAAQGPTLLGSAWSPFAPTIAKLGEIQVKGRRRDVTAPKVEHPLGATFDEKVRVVGYDLAPEPAQQALRLTLYWKALSIMDTSYTVFAHLLDGNGTVISSGDGIPANGEIPTTGWLEGEYISDVHLLPLPADLARGGYPIEVGLYDAATGVRMKTADGKDHLVLDSFNSP